MRGGGSHASSVLFFPIHLPKHGPLYPCTPIVAGRKVVNGRHRAKERHAAQRPTAAMVSHGPAVPHTCGLWWQKRNRDGFPCSFLWVWDAEVRRRPERRDWLGEQSSGR